MKIFELYEDVPSSARTMSEEEFYQFFQQMLDDSNFSSSQQAEILHDFNQTQYDFKQEEMNERINTVFNKWNFPYRIDHITYQSGYEPEYIIRKLK